MNGLRNKEGQFNYLIRDVTIYRLIYKLKSSVYLSALLLNVGSDKNSKFYYNLLSQMLLIDIV